MRGRIIDAATSGPVARAAVELTGSDGRVVSKTTGDNEGRFSLRAPSAGTYALRVRHLGYAKSERWQLHLTSDSVQTIGISMQPIVATLPPTLVRATKPVFSLVRPADLGRRLIGPDRVSELAPRARHVEDYVLFNAIAGVSIYEEPPNIRCARLARGKPITRGTALGYPSGSFPRLSHDLANQIGCMMMFVDNVRVEDMLHVDPGAVEMIVVLLPHEAGVLYGSGASRGVLLVYTKGAAR